MAQRGRVAVASALAGVACTVAYWAGGAAAWNGDVAAFARAEVLGYAFATSTFDLWVSASPASARMNAPIDQGCARALLLGDAGADGGAGARGTPPGGSTVRRRRGTPPSAERVSAHPTLACAIPAFLALDRALIPLPSTPQPRPHPRSQPLDPFTPQPITSLQVVFTATVALVLAKAFQYDYAQSSSVATYVFLAVVLAAAAVDLAAWVHWIVRAPAPAAHPHAGDEEARPLIAAEKSTTRARAVRIPTEPAAGDMNSYGGMNANYSPVGSFDDDAFESADEGYPEADAGASKAHTHVAAPAVRPRKGARPQIATVLNARAIARAHVPAAVVAPSL